MGTVKAMLIALVGVIVLAVPAVASEGVTVGPSRQLIEPGQHTATVMVSNPSDSAVRITSVPMRYAGEQWSADTQTAMFAKPARFTLQPSEQREVLVEIAASTLPCSLMGMGFVVKLPPTAEGIAAQARAVAQFAVNGKGGTEQDCVPLIPGYTGAVPTSSSSSVLPLGIGALVAAGLSGWFVIGRRRKSKPKGRHTRVLRTGW